MRTLCWVLLGCILGIALAFAFNMQSVTGRFRAADCGVKVNHAKASAQTAIMCQNTVGCTMTYTEARAVVEEMDEAQACQ